MTVQCQYAWDDVCDAKLIMWSYWTDETCKAIRWKLTTVHNVRDSLHLTSVTSASLCLGTWTWTQIFWAHSHPNGRYENLSAYPYISPKMHRKQNYLTPEKKVLILHNSLSQYWKKHSSNRAKNATIASLSDAAKHIHFTHNMNVALHYNPLLHQ